MVNDDHVIDVITFNAEIATVISNDDLIAKIFPSLGSIKRLIQYSVI